MAKKNKKKNRPEGFDPNQRKRERIEARRQAKAEEMARRRKAERRERIVRRVGILAVAAFALWFFFVRGGVPDEVLGREIEHYSTSGSGDHVQGTVDYEMSPPVSGAHAASPARCGTYGEALPNENLVHSLEHGAVAVLYEPSISQDEVTQIEELVASYDSHTISAPYEGEMETPIAVVAWANALRLDEFDEPAITEFIEAFRAGGQAPEAFQECDNEVDDDFEVRTSPAPSPGASASPGADATKAPGQDAPKETPKP